MKKTIFLTLIIAVLLVFMIACPTEPPAAASSTTTIYVAGYESNGTNDVAKYWIIAEDGTVTENALTDGTTNARADSIFISGTDVYAAGYEEDGSGVKQATYWKNGAGTGLNSDTTKDAEATSIFVSGTDVYVAGYEYDGTSSNSLAKYWKNGVETVLNNDTGRNAAAFSIYVSGTDVYVAGREYSDPDGNTTYAYVAKYWKNNSSTFYLLNVDQDKNATAQSVFVYGSDAYIAGQESNGTNNIAKYWKNDIGNVYPLTDGSNSAYAKSIFVDTDGVHVAGYEAFTPWIGKYWGPSSTTDLSGDGTGNVMISGMCEDNGDIYIAGEERNASNIFIAKYWKNGTVHSLTDGTNQAQSNSVFVVTE